MSRTPYKPHHGIPPEGAGDAEPLDEVELQELVAEDGNGPAPAAAGSATERSVNVLRKRRYDAIHRGGAAERSQHAKKKLTARERIERLLDPGSFTELDMFAIDRKSVV